MRRDTTRTIQTSPSFAVIQRAYAALLCDPGQEEPQSFLMPESDAAVVVTFFDPSPVLSLLATEPPVEDWLTFQQLLSQWHRERGATSSTTDAALSPAYQSIIGMGDIAVRFILRQLESEGDDPDQWFWALTAITGANPERDEDRGNHARMAESWFGWAKNNGYAW